MTVKKPIDYTARVPLPRASEINSGLTYCRPETALSIFGMPVSPLPVNCAPASAVTSQRLKAALITADVGPFRVTGLRPAMESLKRIFDKVKREHPALYPLISTAGGLCVRCIRGYPGIPSNHAFGAAVDLKIGGILVPLGEPITLKGLLVLYRYFHAEGWYSGMGWARADSMHMEVSDQLMLRWAAEGLI